MSNRVEDLERQVKELRAAVDGLTEELVETKERLRQLESAASAEAETDENADAADGDGSSEKTRRHAGDVHAEMVTTKERHLPDDAGDGGESEAAKAADGDESDDGEESESSDIIVA